jgi:hypothetical protein
VSESDFKSPAPQAGYEPCEECGAPLDPQQRYCVNCAARRGNGANPSSRYFAAMSKKARRPLTRPPAKSPGSRAAAVGFFALLPIAVALGVVVGRGDSGGNENEALLKALRNQEAQTASTATAAPTTATAAKKTAKKQKKSKAGKNNEKGGGGKVVAKTKNGTIHQVTGYHADKQEEEEGAKIVESNPEETGENYIKAQQNLPDVIPVGGEAGSSPAPSNGAEP